MADKNEGTVLEVRTDGKRRQRCLHHPKKKIKFICETCGGIAVCKKCLKPQHKDHQIQSIHGKAVKYIPEEIDNSMIENNVSLKGKDVDEDDILDDGLNDLLAKALKTTEHIDERINQFSEARRELKLSTKLEIEKVRQRGICLKQQVDEVTSLLEKKLKELRKFKSGTLKEHERSLKEFSRTLKDYCAKSKSTHSESSDSGLQLDKNVDLQQEIEQILKKETHVPLPVTDMDEFVPYKTTVEQVLGFFGEIDYEQKSCVSFGNNKNHIVPTQQKSEEISVFQFEDEIMRSICPTSNGCSWIVRETRNMVFTDIQNVSYDGDVATTSVFDAGVLDITSNAADTTLASCTDNTVRRVLPDGQSIVRFRTEARPESLCFQSNNDIVVCFFKKRKVAKYNLKGRQLLSCTDAKTEADFISHPFRVRADKKNDDIAVLNANPYSVVVLDRNFDLKFLYNGKAYFPEDIRKGRLSNSSKPNYQILPNDVCFDHQHNVVFCDAVSKCIVTLSPKGLVLKAISPGNDFPSSLALDRNGYLWIGYNNGEIKVIEY